MPKIGTEIRLEETGKECAAMVKFFFSRRRVRCRTNSLPSFHDFGCELSEIALFIYLM